MTDQREEVSYHFDDDVPAYINSDETQTTHSFRRVLPQMLAVSVKNLVLFGYGLTLGFPTIVIPALKANGTNSDSDFNLSNEEISWFSSINLLCVPLGCFFSGVFTEPTGKRRAMQIIKIPIFLSWLVFHFATSVYHLYIGLCLVGISGGLMETSVLTYVAEVTEPRYRGMLTATGTTCVVIGILVQFVMGTFLKWRTIALVCSAMPLLTIVALFFVPESPYWLLTKNRIKEARKSLAWLRGWVEPHKVSEEFDEIHQALVQNRRHSEETNSSGGFYERFQPYTKRTFLVPFALVSATLFVGCFSGKTPLQTYAVEIFKILETPIDKYHATVFLGLCELIGAILCISLVRFVGKRPLIFVSLIVSAICFSSTALFAHRYGIPSNLTSSTSASLKMPFNETQNSHIGCQYDIFASGNRSAIQFENSIIDCDQKNVNRLSYETKEQPSHKTDTQPNKNIMSWTPLILLLTCALFTHIGIGILPWGLIGEMYPSNVRSGGSGLSSGAGYLFAFFSNKLFLWMLDTLTLPGTFWFYSSVSIVGCIVFYFTLPETEGRSLLEIEAYFANTHSNTRIDSQSNQTV